MLTPRDAIDTLADSRVGSDLRELENFLRQAPSRDLEEFLRLSKQKSILWNQHWIDVARTALQVRLSEDTVTSTKQIIEHTEKLTRQTDIMITESKKLGWLTWALIFLTACLLVLTAGLLFIDWHREVIKLQPGQ